MVGSWSLLGPALAVAVAVDEGAGAGAANGSVVGVESKAGCLRWAGWTAVGVGPSELLAVRLLVIMAAVLLGSGEAGSVEMVVGCAASLIRPLLP